jgi:hypothetical protein
LGKREKSYKILRKRLSSSWLLVDVKNCSFVAN